MDDFHFHQQAFPYIERVQKNAKCSLLAENILFALRCNKRLVKNIMACDTTSAEQCSERLISAPYTTSQQFFSALALSIHDDTVFHIISDFSNASLYIEFGWVAALLIDEDNIMVSMNDQQTGISYSRCSPELHC